jgi:cellulose synthase/poly-beta-1,6-N-acetylglucosamine synthase-like glycosyltransferase
MIIIIALLQLLLLLSLLYYYGLLIASIPKPQFAVKRQERQIRFALAVPAHNEAVVIGATVTNLRQIDYATDLFDVFVVADYCEDETAVTARSAGAICFERQEGERGRKGFALAWLIDQILRQDPKYDAIIVFDADSRVPSRFLTAMSEGLQSGELVLQGQHIISNVNDTIYNRFAAIDMRINNRLRNAARHNLGFSCRLMGDAMCFSRAVLEKYPWSTFSLTEDIEYGVFLLQQGVRVAYVPKAESFGQAAGNWQRAEKQRMRWEGGVLDMRRRLGWQLLMDGLGTRRLALIDRGIEMLLPPYSILAVLSLFVFIGQWLANGVGLFPLWATAVIVMSWMLLPVIALLLDRAPLKLFVTLFYGPLYLTWRLWVRLLTVLRGQRVQWVRTPRQEESPK